MSKSSPSDWSLFDQQFLRKLRITPGECPPASPRFVVERDGDDAILYDRHTRKPWRFRASEFADAYDEASVTAAHLNMNEETAL